MTPSAVNEVLRVARKYAVARHGLPISQIDEAEQWINDLDDRLAQLEARLVQVTEERELWRNQQIRQEALIAKLKAELP